MALNSPLTVCAGALVLSMEALGQGKVAEPPPYAVLEDVPRIGYGIHLCPFPGSLYACLQHLGDPCE